MIQVDNLLVQFGGRILFNKINCVVKPSDRIGLVGKNGAGKSTLLKILIDEIRADEGQISMPNKTSLGYLPQEKSFVSTKTVYEETATAFEKINELKTEFTQLTKEVEQRTDYESDSYQKLLEHFSGIQERLSYLGADNMRANTEKVLKGLGFENGQFDRPLATFSGGWQMRVELAKILLAQPNYILLDEPTNHLDIESIIWLENFLKSYPGGILLISHDQRFLDNVSNRTIEIVNGKLYDYAVPYSKFLELREERREKQISDKKRQEKFVEHTEQLINKFRAKKNKAKFAQSLIKKLDRLEDIEIDDMENAKINFAFPPAPRSGKVVVNIKGLNKYYGDNHVLNNIDFELERGEKIAFVGKNGEGKTTLSKIITGKTDSTGICELGYNVDIGYYEQHQAENLDGNLTVFQTIDNAAQGDMRLKVRALLGAFLFSGEDADKKVKVLSGGEKSRLAMAKLLLDPVNLLILDEPTNHLDMRSKNILKQAIQNFEGSVIIVSHDREFLKDLTDKVYEFKNRKIKPYYGDVYNFLESRNIEYLDDLNLKKSVSDSPAKTETLQPDQPVKTAKQLHEAAKKLKRIKNKVGKIEKQIDALENEKATIETQMSDPSFYDDAAKADLTMRHYKNLKKQISTAEEEWETAATELEELSNQA